MINYNIIGNDRLVGRTDIDFRGYNMLSKFSVKRPYTVVVAVILVLILGIVSFINLQTDLLPSLDLPYLVIMTSYPGASPEEVEMIVTKPIEQVVATTNNIKNVNSISRENSSVVILEFNNDVNMDSTIIEINGSLDLIKGVWNDSVGSPMVIRLNPDMLPIMVASVDAEGMDITEISQMVNDKIIPELESVNGVASVTGTGLLEEKIEVKLSVEKIDNLNKRILEKVDSKLSEVEDQLNNAKKEIEAGKNKLASEKNKRNSEIAEGEKALSLAREQLALGESKYREGEAELNKTRDTLQDALKEIERQEQELLAGEKLLLSKGNKLSTEEQKNLELIRQGLEQINIKKEETNNALQLVLDSYKLLEGEKATLDAAKAELDKQQEQLNQGKLLLATEMDKAEQKLIEGESVLNRQIEEFEKSREEAFKKATLDGVITTNMISGILTAQNFSMPAGYVTESGNDYIVKVGDKINNIEELKNLLLFDTGENSVGKIRLNDVADIKHIDNSEDIYAKVNGNDAVVLTFQKQSNFPTAEVSNSIKERIEELQIENEGLSITPLMDQGVYIDIVVDSVLDNILYGGILAILILIVFLKDIKPTLIIALSIPISIIFAIAMMYFTGITINVISLAGLALGVGMLVDNSIVVIENIYRLRSEGMSASKAAVYGAKEVAGAITSSTLTTACVFLPIVFTKGISKQLFTDMGLTIAYSLLASLIVALTLVPTMASAMLKNTKEKEHRLFDKLISLYEGLLRWTLRHKAITMISVVALLALSAYFAVSMGTSFIPEMETPQMSLSIDMPKESTREEAINISNTVIERLMDIEGIETIGAMSGGGMRMMGMGEQQGGGSTSITMYLLLDENKTIKNAEIEKEIIRVTEDLEATIKVNTSNMDMTALGGSGIEVRVKGREIDTLRDIALDIAEVLENTEGAIDINSGVSENSSEMRIKVNKEKAMENGLTVAQVFSSINSTLSKGKTTTTLSIENKDYPVIVVDEKNQGIERSDIENLTIKVNKDGEEKEISIGDIADITEEKGLSSIRRDSQVRYVSITAAIDKDHNIGLVSRDFENKLKDYNMPDGYRAEIVGENKMINDSLRDLTYMILLAIVFVYLIMVAQFQSLLSPFIVMFTIPLAFTGGLLALIITGNNISLIAMLGLLVLSGVVVNNGIVFVDYTNQLRDTGLNKGEALVLAGKTRMRPILMTAITTILGLFTLSVGVGVGAEMLQPLAIVSIGGLIYATILTLFVVPVMYDLLHKNKIRRNFLEEDE